MIPVIGNLSLDEAKYADGRLRQSVGGAALFVSVAASRAGVLASPISVIGTDLDWIRDDNLFDQVDLSHVLTLPGKSCTFRIRYGPDGDVQAIESDFGVATELTNHAVRSISRGFCHICCRRPLDLTQLLPQLIERGVRFSLDFFVSSIREMLNQSKPYLSHADIIFVNNREWELLTEIADPKSIQRIIITNGPRSARLLRKGRQTAECAPARVAASELTGAGDTLAGTVLACLIRGVEDTEALEMGVRAATKHVLTAPTSNDNRK